MSLTQEDYDSSVAFPFTLHETYECYVGAVFDGDTVTCCTNLRHPFQGLFRVRVRIAGINAEEIKSGSSKSIEARDCLRDMVLNKNVLIEFLRWDKYGGRAVGHIRLIDHQSPPNRWTGDDNDIEIPPKSPPIVIPLSSISSHTRSRSAPKSSASIYAISMHTKNTPGRSVADILLEKNLVVPYEA